MPNSDVDLIINTTSFGMKDNECLKIDINNLKDTLIFVDIIYNPKETELLKLFKKEGFVCMNGLSMLIEQAAVSFELWFNISLNNKDIEEVKKFVKHPIKIAITGKIASGKSTISEIIKKIGFSVFEADKEVNKLFKEQAVKIKIKDLFFDKVDNLIKKDGSINKVLLGNYVFLKEEELKQFGKFNLSITKSRETKIY